MIAEKFTPIEEDKCKCTTCSKEISCADVLNIGECPDCKSLISILMTTDKGLFEANKLKVNTLKEGDLLVMGQFFHEILNISITSKSECRLALKDYGVATKRNDDIVTIILGTGDYW